MGSTSATLARVDAPFEVSLSDAMTGLALWCWFCRCWSRWGLTVERAIASVYACVPQADSDDWWGAERARSSSRLKPRRSIYSPMHSRLHWHMRLLFRVSGGASERAGELCGLPAASGCLRSTAAPWVRVEPGLFGWDWETEEEEEEEEERLRDWL